MEVRTVLRDGALTLRLDVGGEGLQVYATEAWTPEVWLV